MPKTTQTPELIVPGIIPELYRNFVNRVYNDMKECTTIEQAKKMRFSGNKPGALSVCASKDSILFFERPQNVFARITFNKI
jgi:hypothetical protein